MKVNPNKDAESRQRLNVVSNIRKISATHKSKSSIPFDVVGRKKNERMTKGDLRAWANRIINQFDESCDKILNALANQREKIIETKQLDSSEFMSYANFMNAHLKFEFPLASNIEFEAFNHDLTLNYSNVKTDLVKHLIIAVNTKFELIDNVKLLIKKFLKSQVLNLYTVQQERNNKKLFNKTPFCICLTDFLCSIYRSRRKQQVTEKKVWEAIGITFNLAKDRDRPRNRK